MLASQSLFTGTGLDVSFNQLNQRYYALTPL